MSNTPEDDGHENQKDKSENTKYVLKIAQEAEIKDKNYERNPSIRSQLHLFPINKASKPPSTQPNPDTSTQKGKFGAGVDKLTKRLKNLEEEDKPKPTQSFNLFSELNIEAPEKKDQSSPLNQRPELAQKLSENDKDETKSIDQNSHKEQANVNADINLLDVDFEFSKGMPDQISIPYQIQQQKENELYPNIENKIVYQEPIIEPSPFENNSSPRMMNDLPFYKTRFDPTDLEDTRQFQQANSKLNYEKTIQPSQAIEPSQNEIRFSPKSNGVSKVPMLFIPKKIEEQIGEISRKNPELSLIQQSNRSVSPSLHQKRELDQYSTLAKIEGSNRIDPIKYNPYVALHENETNLNKNYIQVNR